MQPQSYVLYVMRTCIMEKAWNQGYVHDFMCIVAQPSNHDITGFERTPLQQKMILKRKDRYNDTLYMDLCVHCL